MSTILPFPVSSSEKDSDTSLSMEDIWQRIISIALPDPSISLITPASANRILPSPEALSDRNRRRLRKAECALAALALAIYLKPMYGLPLWGMFGLAFWFVRDWNAYLAGDVYKSYRKLDKQWENFVEAENAKFIEVLEQATQTKQAWEDIVQNTEEQSQQMVHDFEAAQRDHYLRQHPISGIEGIGRQHQECLVKNQIETAADIYIYDGKLIAMNVDGNEAIHGFGNVLISRLSEWKEAIEEEFARNFKVNRQDILGFSAMKKKSSAERKQLEKSLLAALSELTDIQANFSKVQKRWQRKLRVAYGKWQQAELDQQAAADNLFAIVGTVCIACIFVLLAIRAYVHG